MTFRKVDEREKYQKSRLSNRRALMPQRSMEELDLRACLWIDMTSRRPFAALVEHWPELGLEPRSTPVSLELLAFEDQWLSTRHSADDSFDIWDIPRRISLSACDKCHRPSTAEVALLVEGRPFLRS